MAKNLLLNWREYGRMLLCSPRSEVNVLVELTAKKSRGRLSFWQPGRLFLSFAGDASLQKPVDFGVEGTPNILWCQN
jgi:hypothetical protein